MTDTPTDQKLSDNAPDDHEIPGAWATPGHATDPLFARLRFAALVARFTDATDLMVAKADLAAFLVQHDVALANVAALENAHRDTAELAISLFRVFRDERGYTDEDQAAAMALGEINHDEMAPYEVARPDAQPTPPAWHGGSQIEWNVHGSVWRAAFVIVPETGPFGAGILAYFPDSGAAELVDRKSCRTAVS
jgi:hypothetical protein